MTKIIETLGSQAVVASVDYVEKNKNFYVCDHFGKIVTNIKLKDFLSEVEKLKVGEIFLQNITNDGSAKGFDINIQDEISSSCQYQLFYVQVLVVKIIL